MRPWSLLWRLVLYRPWLALACLISWVVISLVPVALGLVARAFFDALSGGAPASAGLWWLAVLPLAVQGVRLLTTWISVPLNVTQRFAVGALLSKNILAHLLSRPGAAALPGSPGDAISRFRDDVDEVATFVSTIRLLSVAGECLTFAITLVLMLQVNAFVTGAAALPLLGVVLLARAAGRRINQYRDRSREATGRVTGALGEIFGMVTAIRLAGAEAHVAEHVRRLGDQRRVETVRDSLFSELLRSLFFNTANLGTGLVLLLAAGSMRAGTFTVGDFALFASSLGRVAVFTGTLGDLLARSKQAGVSLGRMQALMAGAPPEALAAYGPVHLEGPVPEVPRPTLSDADRLVTLEAENLTFMYPNSGRGVRGAGLSLRRGSFTVVTGRIGSGKTTLLRALLGLVPLQDGTIRWNGRAVTDPARHFQPPRSSYTPQAPVLFSAPLQENILLGLPAEQADLDGAIHAAVLERDLAGLEHHLQTPVGNRGVKLSGGQVQRTAAARMFVRAPELLVFDDLSSALDVETEQLLWERLRQRTGATCLAVSHRRGALQAADQIIVMKDGRVESAGSLNQLLAECAEFRTIWEGAAQAGAN